MHRANGGRAPAASMISALAAALLTLPPAVSADDAKPYSSAIVLQSVAPGAATALTFSFKAVGEDYEEVDDIQITLPAGGGVNAAAFATACKLAGSGNSAAGGCPTSSPAAKVGSGTMTVDMLGMHTVEADAYFVEAASGPGQGTNLAFYFPGGQVFGVTEQTVLGTITLDGRGPPSVQILDVQSQLSLPFGSSAELADGSFRFSGQAGIAPFTNPPSGDADVWEFSTRLSWAAGAQSAQIRASAEK